MDFSGGPAALGGVMMCVALSAWTLGRWQGAFVAPERGCADASGVAGPTRPLGTSQAVPTDHSAASERAAWAKRHAALASEQKLGAMHAEISAYRRAEQVLADFDSDCFSLRLLSDRAEGDCRYLASTGEPACAVAAPARLACANGLRCHSASLSDLPVRAVQPSPPVAGLTRV